MFEKYGRVSKFKINNERYQPYYLKYKTTSGDSYWVSSGYFNENDYATINETSDADWTKNEQNFAISKRFVNFNSTSVGDSISSYGLKLIEGNYFDCYCQHWCTVISPFTSIEYDNKSS